VQKSENIEIDIKQDYIQPITTSIITQYSRLFNKDLNVDKKNDMDDEKLKTILFQDMPKEKFDVKANDVKANEKRPGVIFTAKVKYSDFKDVQVELD